MAFVSHIPYLLVQQHPQQMPIQYPTIVVPQPQPQPQPQFLQLQLPPPPPVSIMVPTMVVAQQPPPLFFTAPSAQPSSLAAAVNLPRGSGITLRIIFYGHASNDGDDGDDVYTPPLCVSSAIYEAGSLPSRDALLAGIAVWAGHHGLVIKHAGGRIDPFKVKLYVLPRCKGVLYGIEYEPGVGLVVPADVVRVVKLGGIEEKDWEGALEEMKREGYGAVVAVDMGEAAASAVSTPDPAVAVSST